MLDVWLSFVQKHVKDKKMVYLLKWHVSGNDVHIDYVLWRPIYLIAESCSSTPRDLFSVFLGYWGDCSVWKAFGEVWADKMNMRESTLLLLARSASITLSKCAHFAGAHCFEADEACCGEALLISCQHTSSEYELPSLQGLRDLCSSYINRDTSSSLAIRYCTQSSSRPLWNRRDEQWEVYAYNRPNTQIDKTR